MQIVGDKHGNVVWVGERDCSAQRRHQKLIEEARRPGSPDGVDEAMGAAAVKVAKACGYVNAGTVEFLYQDGEFFFLEMNTRLQVEHPVTEVVTGIDLVERQLRVASGEPLSFTQDEIARSGAATPSRSASTPRTRPAARFLPSPGTITKLVAPDGFGVRCDAGYEAGDDGQPVLRQPRRQARSCGARTATTAIARTIRALEEIEIEGIATTIPADLAILRHPDFAAVEHSTKWVEERLDLSAPCAATPPSAPAATTSAEPEALVERTSTSRSTASASTSACGCPSRPRSPPPGRRRRRPRRRRRSASARGRGGVGPAAATSPCRCRARSSRCSSRWATPSRSARPSCVLEAMKMENQITAEQAGTVTRDQGRPRRHRRRRRRRRRHRRLRSLGRHAQCATILAAHRGAACTPAGTSSPSAAPTASSRCWGQFFVAGADRRRRCSSPLTIAAGRRRGAAPRCRGWRTSRTLVGPVDGVRPRATSRVAYPIARGSGAPLAGLGGIWLLGDDLGRARRRRHR